MKPRLQRQLLTVMAADISGYSRLTEADEENIHLRFRSLKVDVIDPCIINHRGRVTKSTGDGFIAVFESTLDAVTCAISLQRETAAVENSTTDDRKIQFRMGINHGLVIVEPEDVYGTEVNIAARLEQIAPPGGIVISSAVREIVDGRLKVDVDNLGTQHFKNIARPVRAYALNVPGLKRASARRSKRRIVQLPSVAILPFEAAGQSRGKSFLGVGLAQQIAVGLAGIKGLMIIAHTSGLNFQHPIDVQKVGQSLGVKYVVSGRIRRSRNELEIFAEFADVKTGAVIWNDVYRGKRENIFDLQEQIADRIVWNIAPQVRHIQLQRARRKRTDSLDAHDHLTEAIELIYNMDFASFARAGELLNRAIAADNEYASAYAYASLWKLHNIAQGWTVDREADSAEAIRLAQEAVIHDPMDGFAIALLAHSKAFLMREYDESRTLFDRALKAAPSNAMVWTLSSGVYAYLGLGKQAVERAQRGLRLSPTDSQSYYYLSFLGLAHYSDEHFEEAAIWGRKTMTLNPRFNANLRWLTAALVGLGELEEARIIAQALLKNQPRFRITKYEGLCPLAEPLRETFLARLKCAGLPD